MLLGTLLMTLYIMILMYLYAIQNLIYYTIFRVKYTEIITQLKEINSKLVQGSTTTNALFAT